MKSLVGRRLLNSRRVAGMLGVEFLDRLYAQHSYSVNPFVLNSYEIEVENGLASVYVSAEEFDRAVSSNLRLFESRQDQQLQSLTDSLRRPRTRATALVEDMGRTDAEALPTADKVMGIVDSVSVALSDIYEINLVQVEWVLQRALARKLVASGQDPRAVGEISAQLLDHGAATAMGREEGEFRSLVDRCAKLDTSQVDAALASYLPRYNELTAAYGGQPTTLRVLRHRFDELLDASGSGRTGAGRARHDSRATEFLRHEPIAELVKCLRLLGSVRDRNKVLMGRVSQVRSIYLQALAADLGISHADLLWYGLDELLGSLDGFRVSPREIERRTRRLLIVRSRRRRDASRRFADGATVRAGQIRAMPAAPGQVRGTVFLGDAKDPLEMRAGQILVVRGTDFDLGVLLSLAGGFVTSELGLLSHAAVIARERGVPCVLGVDDINVFHDGETVLLDGTTGLVTLERREGEADTVRPAAPRTAARGRLRRLRQSDPRRAGGKANGLKIARDIGLRVPRTIRVVHCDDVPEAGDVDAIRALAAEAVEEFRRHELISVRSSALGEDGATRTAAGLFESAVRVPLALDEVEKALRRVISSAQNHKVVAYFSQEWEQRLAIVITGYVEAELQGTACFPAKDQSGSVLIEYDSELDGHQLVEAIDTDSVDLSPSTIRHHLQDLSRAAREVSRVMRSPVEVEWALDEDGVVILQARRIRELP